MLIDYSDLSQAELKIAKKIMDDVIGDLQHQKHNISDLPNQVTSMTMAMKRQLQRYSEICKHIKQE